MTDLPPDEGQPQPEQQLPSFDEMPLTSDVKQSLADMGYTHPTPVQHAIFDPAVRGSDLVVQARTGTGKTAAFGLPLIDQMIKRTLSAAQALILAPTRELALQVSRELTRIGERRGVKNAAVYGGAPMQRQIDAIRDGAHIVVGTPGRVLDHLKRGTLDARNIRVLVLDESDEMLSMGFERELSAILEFLPAERQTLLFSATLPPDIVRIARDRLREPQFITLSGDHIGALDVTHFVYFIREDKIGTFLRILETENPESAVVFCNTREETERVAQALQRAGFDSDWLNGDLPQSDREKVMAATREGKLRYLVATDVAARGIDISHLTHVINYDFPDTAEQYVHRTGRTGRMGRTGTAINLILPQDIGALYMLRLTYKIKPFEKQLPTTGELKTRAEADQIQMLADAFAARTTDPDDIAMARRLLTHDKAEVIIAGLLRDHLGERPKAVEEAAAARRGRAPRRVSTPPAAPARAPAPPAPRAPAPAPAPAVAPAPAPAVAPAPVEPPPAPVARAEREPAAARPEREPAAARPEREPAAARPEREPAARPEREERRRDDRPAPRLPRRREDVRPPRDHERGAERTEDDDSMDLPRYEVSELPGEPIAAAPVQAPVGAPGAEAAPAKDMSRMSHSAFVDWSPPAQDDDDVPILEAMGDSMTPPAAVEDIPVEDQSELFVNVGRRDGARNEDFMRVLEAAEGLESADVLRIRIRDRHTFVVVRRAVLDRALEALTGARIGSRTANAEIAKPRTP